MMLGMVGQTRREQSQWLISHFNVLCNFVQIGDDRPSALQA